MKKATIKKSLLKKIARILIKLRISTIFKIREKLFTLRFYPSSVSRVLWVEQYLSGDYCQQEKLFMMRYLRFGDVVIDVGANIGLLTVLSSILVGEQGKVYAIEPHPKIYKFLLGNLALNSVKNVRKFNCALGNKNCPVKFSDRTGDDRNSVLTEGSGIIVDQRRLDELGIEDEQVALLKIDVEGYEKFVIEGAGRLLKNVHCVYFEAIEKNLLQFGYSLEELVNILTTNNFKILEILSNNVCIINPSGYEKPPTNLVAVRDINAFLVRCNYTTDSLSISKSALDSRFSE